MALSIVLFEPLIPQNTGSIARLTAATRTRLHLIEPLGFELSDKYLKRAGLDYWPETDVHVHKNWQAFLEKTDVDEKQLWFFSKKAEHSYCSVSYGENDVLVFGNETQGLSPELHARYAERRLRIPIDNERVRSLNLACSAAVALYEARRQLGLGC